MSIITLITDFGLKDGNVGVMKGVIWKIAPEVQIADLSHLIAPQAVQEGALILSRSAPYFPPGTIHVAVVDPGVGTTRRPIAARLGGQFFVLPDNGLITLLLEQAETASDIVEFVHLDRPEYWLSIVSNVFHGRDIFAPCAAHLANGALLTELGTPIHNPQRLKFPIPTQIDHGLLGEVIHIDYFGNLSTSIRRQHLGEPAALSVRLAGVEILGLVQTFGERPPGELVALYGSTGYLIVSVVNGSAAQRLGVKVGDPVEVTW
jgi:S-adenosyl-L-methionine hydrolase (adenosine-forming)